MISTMEMQVAGATRVCNSPTRNLREKGNVPSRTFHKMTDAPFTTTDDEHVHDDNGGKENYDTTEEQQKAKCWVDANASNKSFFFNGFEESSN